jgi:hypothetical protein
MTIVPETTWRWRVLTAVLIFAAVGLHVRYLAHECPLDLAPDEAHYWLWSQQLDASYYSKGPLTAYLIRSSCELFGQSVLAVRFPAVVCGGLLLVGLYVLTLRCFGNERLAAVVVGFALTMPPLAMSRTLMTIDAPFVCLWTWALVFGHQAFFRRSAWAWPALGLGVGLGILAKYTMALWIPSAALFLALSREHRPLARRTGPWFALLLAVLCCVPIVWWNFQNDWVSFRHVGGQAGMTSGGTDGLRWFGPLKFIAEQFALLLGLGFLVWVIAVFARRPQRETGSVHLYLWCLSAPLFLFFALASLRADVLPNWPAVAYLSGLVLAAEWMDGLAHRSAPWQRRVVAGAFAGIGAFGVMISVFAHDTTRFRPVLAALAGEPTVTNPLPLRRIDPTCRMRGWRHMSAAIDRSCERLHAQGVEPILAASRWTVASEMAFYCEGRPTVYSLGSALWDRQSQFDLWRPNPVHDADAFRGRTFVFVDVGQVPPEIVAAFERIEPTQTVLYEEAGQLIAFWNVTVCHGFRGFAKAPNRQY